MNGISRVNQAPSKPVLIYDGDCRFCTLWVRRWSRIAGPTMVVLPFQEARVADLFPELPHEQLESAVQFVAADGSVDQGAAAAFQALALNPSWRWPLVLYQRFPLLARCSERCYQFVAAHRTGFSRLTRVLWGKQVEPADYFVVRKTFLILLGLIYFAAFVSLWVQITGLSGKDGILPATDLMNQARGFMAAHEIGLDRYHELPTLCWFGSSDAFLQFQCAAGAVLALLLIAGITPPVCLALMWLLYLSLATVCREFLSFQWDNLLLEVGLLAIFLAPLQLLPRPSREKFPSRTVLWLLRLLLFKLMFLSGVVKLASGDPTWRNLTALTRHYETQPLPTWIGWYAHQMPLWFQKRSCALMFAIELLVPFLIFMPRRVRMAGAFALVGFQFLILLTGNYTFFNWLTLALCLLLFDDQAWRRLWPTRLISFYAEQPDSAFSRPNRWRFALIAPIAAVFVLVSVLQVALPFGRPPGWTNPVIAVYQWLAPFRSINSYGLFSVMTTKRMEIVVEGSDTGHDWKEYEFPYKPGDVKRPPAFVAPYQPRLDWQMWFAALGDYRQNPWFVNLCIRLLQGSPPALKLLRYDPFASHPPKFIRAQFYEYRFTTFQERRRTGAWWKRELKGQYLPPISLDMLGQSQGAGSQ